MSDWEEIDFTFGVPMPDFDAPDENAEAGDSSACLSIVDDIFALQGRDLTDGPLAIRAALTRRPARVMQAAGRTGAYDGQLDRSAEQPHDELPAPMHHMGARPKPLLH